MLICFNFFILLSFPFLSLPHSSRYNLSLLFFELNAFIAARLKSHDKVKRKSEMNIKGGEL